MEHEGLVRAVGLINNAGLNIAQIITDRHKQNEAWIRRNLLDTCHYFDIWHVSKGKGTILLRVKESGGGGGGTAATYYAYSYVMLVASIFLDSLSFLVRLLLKQV